MTTFEIAAPDVIADVLDGEVVIINLDTGSYFRLSGPAALAWQAVAAGADTDRIPAALRHDLDPFLESLVTHGLLRGAQRAPVGDDITWPSGPLDLEVYDDLQDLLNLDPVHDVPEGAQWPHASP